MMWKPAGMTESFVLLSTAQPPFLPFSPNICLSSYVVCTVSRQPSVALLPPLSGLYPPPPFHEPAPADLLAPPPASDCLTPPPLLLPPSAPLGTTGLMD
ncbi:hypothetical protein Q8A67_018869 [Cirrhinus molitorella]|uniref:Uncharacterized protein n=1 Tax=Cirrhinus molitorella TaxID=172907 RepID=A0AA88PH60_9TELE|nr:hypothetical protein Q8A67_018869 [Cirrhinus molitorella]